MPIEFTDKTPKGSTSGRRRGAVGKPTIDIQRLGQAIAGPGLDTRQWLAVGTVGLRDEDGDFFTGAPPDASEEEKKEAAKLAREAIFVDRLGAIVSVQLEPIGRIIHARWNGIGCGRFGFMLFPLVPGDEVLISIPDGDLNSDAISVVAVLANQTAQIPQNWNNDRVLFSLNVPFEITAPAVKIRSANLDLNGRKVNFSTEEI